MMGPRKRGRDEMESSEPPKETSLLNRIRNMWEFACVMQYIFIFGKAVKIDEDFDIEVLDTNPVQCSHIFAFKTQDTGTGTIIAYLFIRTSRQNASNPVIPRSSKKLA